MRQLIVILLLIIFYTGHTQEMVNPVIKTFGGIYDIPDADLKPNPNQEYKIVIDIYGGTNDKTRIDGSLNNVARMLNLHAIGGVPPENMSVVLAIHAKSTFSILNKKAYRERFGWDNPNIGLIKELKEAGVRVAVCGQSLMGRGIDKKQVNKEVEIATSMLTTVTSYQMKGYELLKF